MASTRWCRGVTRAGRRLATARARSSWHPTELWDAIKASWEEDLTEDKIEMAYRLLTPVMTLINDHNGGSNFKLPHTGLRKQMREDGWDY